MVEQELTVSPGLRPLRELEDELLTLAGHLNAGEYRLLQLIHQLIHELDQRNDWFGPGLKSLAHWLNWHIGLALGAAREKVRAANALPGLPLISQAFRTGEVSYSKVRAMTRVATPENEQFLLQLARHSTASHLERTIRLYRLASVDDTAKDACRQRARRAVDYYFDADGMFHLQAVLPPEDAAQLLAALDGASDAIRREAQEAAESEAVANASASPHGEPETNPETSSEMPVGPASEMQSESSFGHDQAGHDQAGDKHTGCEHDGNENNCQCVSAETALRAPGTYWLEQYADADWPAGALRADALVRLSRPDNTTNPRELIIHVDAALLSTSDPQYPDPTEGPQAGRPAVAHFHGGAAIAPEVARRLGCDSLLRALVRDTDGNLLNLGRRQRLVSPALRRALELRDPTCRFPGCTQHRRLHAHHIAHWADGGETSLDNLVQLCSYHHHLVHEGGYGVTRTHDGEIVFTDRNATPTPLAPGRLCSSARGVSGLTSASAAAGLHIDADTAECLWDGVPGDLGQTIAFLQQDESECSSQA